MPRYGEVQSCQRCGTLGGRPYRLGATRPGRTRGLCYDCYLIHLSEMGKSRSQPCRKCGTLEGRIGCKGLPYRRDGLCFDCLKLRRSCKRCGTLEGGTRDRALLPYRDRDGLCEDCSEAVVDERQPSGSDLESRVKNASLFRDPSHAPAEHFPAPSKREFTVQSARDLYYAAWKRLRRGRAALASQIEAQAWDGEPRGQQPDPERKPTPWQKGKINGDTRTRKAAAASN